MFLLYEKRKELVCAVCFNKSNNVKFVKKKILVKSFVFFYKKFFNILEKFFHIKKNFLKKIKRLLFLQDFLMDYLYRKSDKFDFVF